MALVIEFLLMGAAVFGLSWILVALVRSWAIKRELMDFPNARSLHSRPTPRGGGLVIVLLTLGGLAAVQLMRLGMLGQAAVGLILGGGIVAMVGWMDDVRGLPALLRLGIHGLAALLFVWMSGAMPHVINLAGWDLHFGVLALPCALLWLAGLTNAYNFMDGIDGIAAGQAVVAGGAWLIIGAEIGLLDLSFAALILAAASGGFLIHNLPPARIFMGDVGSGFLGFFFAALALLAVNLAQNPKLIWVGVLVVAPFVFDTTTTLLRRACTGERIFQAHCSHLYQRLVQCGHSHGQVTALYMALAITTSVCGIAYLKATTPVGELMSIGVAIVLMVALIVGTTWRERVCLR